jgi:hypothetical protein
MLSFAPNTHSAGLDLETATRNRRPEWVRNDPELSLYAYQGGTDDINTALAQPAYRHLAYRAKPVYSDEDIERMEEPGFCEERERAENEDRNAMCSPAGGWQ